MFVKICGITRMDDALQAAAAGASALGFVFWADSPRAIDTTRARAIVEALPEGVWAVGVFVNETAEAIRRIVSAVGLHAAQLHGEEAPMDVRALGCPVFRSATVANAGRMADEWPDAVLLVDAHDPARRGGTGTQVDWARASDIARARDIVLAGGLTPLNVAEAIATVRPYGVDVSSGVETAPGVKDASQVSLFVANARRAFGRR